MASSWKGGALVFIHQCSVCGEIADVHTEHNCELLSVDLLGSADSLRTILEPCYPDLQHGLHLLKAPPTPATWPLCPGSILPSTLPG
jgi:hypothetical protein